MCGYRLSQRAQRLWELAKQWEIPINLICLWYILMWININIFLELIRTIINFLINKFHTIYTNNLSTSMWWFFNNKTPNLIFGPLFSTIPPLRGIFWRVPTTPGQQNFPVQPTNINPLIRGTYSCWLVSGLVGNIRNFPSFVEFYGLFKSDRPAVLTKDQKQVTCIYENKKQGICKILMYSWSPCIHELMSIESRDFFFF